MTTDDNIKTLNKTRDTLNKLFDEINVIAHSRELKRFEILQMVLRRQCWELDNAAGEILRVRDDMAYGSNEAIIQNLKGDVAHLEAKNKDLKARLSKYEPMDKLTEEEIKEGKTNKINAIKMVRQRTGLSLKEAKELVETVYPYIPPASVNVPF